MIGFKERESSGPRKIPDFSAESQRFRVELRKSQFFIKSHFSNLNDDVILSEMMKNFSYFAKEKRNISLKETLLQRDSTNTWHPIPITKQEEEAQRNEKNMYKNELLSIINSTFFSLPETLRPKYKNLSNKTKEQLLTILQELRNIYNTVETTVEEEFSD
jgi:hypothetical protein